MKLKIEICCDNAAFGGGNLVPEVKRILATIDDADSRDLRDCNGNTVGKVVVVNPRPVPGYLFDVTDTFGGEPNYCWARRYAVCADSFTEAVRKVNKEEGYGRLRKVMTTGDFERWNVQGACICIMGWWADGPHDLEGRKVLE